MRTLASLKKQIARAIKQIRATKDNIVSTQDPFAGSYVILYVTSQHIISSHSGWDSDAYHRLASTVRRYGALVQTDICGGNAHNIHGIEHGWAWFARFLNKISAYRCYYNSLKRISPDGRVWSIHQRYKSQFLKAANVVREHFLPKLRAKKDAANLQTIITDITAYLDYQMYVSQGTYRKN
ncbi:PREDICTED: protein GLE1-like [Brassica oleracea var. oleracea]|uniref:protein GLE1-like n=1 Tax=Brassica oleracea var. oleracea TaxID=109376 RepID=UPI0006A6EC97|nr:PREDICTED: protein GLE1-like [Brassica oleracea var. oleracea]XP_013584678.1 PREDICTED: protein GLE1-like [Brassica oleracea var. oleracea]XP_013584679.1 PREDICTED: protein GLE1-like [Brassica oleracea var. oleracea]